MGTIGNVSYLDLIVLILYFGLMAGMGPLFARRNRTTEGYFLGDRSFPGWLIGFSMFATSISSITFMAYPGDAYKTSWLRMLPNYTLPIAVLMASHIFLPFFRRGKITSAYEYLEGRFGPNVRLYAACAFIFAQLIRISMILFLVSQLLQEVLGLDVAPYWYVIIGGTITSFYTIMGGIRAVLWTDFIQAIVLWVGGVICLLIVAYALGGPFEGIAEIFRVALDHGKFAYKDLVDGEFKTIPLGIDFTQKTVLLMLLMGMGNWMYEYAGNQNVIQRYCAARSTKDARIAMWVCCWFSVPTWGMFMFVGTALYVFYQKFPTEKAAAILTGAEDMKAEQILPYFVVENMPIGIAGLVIAAVLAAAMSSISSSINGVSAVSIVDVYRRRIAKDRDDHHYLNVARYIGVAQAIIMMIGAMILVGSQSQTLQDTGNVLTALTAAGLAGLYLLGFLTMRCDGRSVFVAIGCTLSFTLWMALSNYGVFEMIGLDALKSPIDTYYAGLIGHCIMFVVGYVLGMTVLKRREPVAENMSMWTQSGEPLD